MSKKYLTDDERNELIEKYAEDKLNNPPSNISDKTLIDNYGNDGQKGRLEIENFDVAILTVPNFKTHPSPGDGDAIKEEPKGDESIGKENDVKPIENEKPLEGANVENNQDKDREFLIEEYKRLYEVEPDLSLPNDELRALNLTKEKENETLQGPDPEAAKYAAAFNDYVRLTGQKPFSGWNLSQLENELSIEKSKRDEAVKASEQNKSEAEKQAIATSQKLGTEETVLIKNKETGVTKRVTKITYENYIAKSQPEWQAVPPIPKEIQ